MHRMILGDNQFFGVNHMSEERAMARAVRFQDTRKIIDVLDMAYEMGVRAVSFSTHDRVAAICDHFRERSARYDGLTLYPVLPYAHKYASSVAEKGLLGTIRETVLTNHSVGRIAGILARGGSAVVRKDSREIMKLLIDFELKMFEGLRLGVVFLQNIVTDLLLGLGWGNVLRDFVEYVESRFGVRAGFMTLNLPALVDLLHRSGVENPVVCSVINKIGFQMSPSVEAYEESLRAGGFDALAMTIMAGGAVPPREAIEYVSSLPSVHSILFGASTRPHIEEFLRLGEEIPPAGSRPEESGSKARLTSR